MEEGGAVFVGKQAVEIGKQESRSKTLLKKIPSLVFLYKCCEIFQKSF